MLRTETPSVRLKLWRPYVYQRLQSLAFALVVFMLMSSDLALTQIQDNTTSTVHGTVINAVTRDPVGRALVYSPDDRYATLTDSEGHFEFELPKAVAESGGFVVAGIPGGLSWLMARKPGFVDDPAENRQVEVTPGKEITIPLVPEGLIIGRVTAGTEVAADVNVQLMRQQVQDGMPRWMPQGSERTNSNGEFRFAELLPGAYKVLTSEWMDNDPETFIPGGQRYGYPPAYYLNAADFSTAATIRLTAGQTLQADFSLVRHPYYSVKIPVVNVEQNGGLNITVSPQGQRGPGFSLGYNWGRDAIEGTLPNGKYLVEANSYGPNSASGSVSITVAGAPVEGPAMVLARGNSIPINIKEEFTSTEWNASGTTSSNGRTFTTPRLRLLLNVWAEPADDFLRGKFGGNLRNPTGPDDNSMVLENLTPGRYWLQITAQRGYVASASMGGVDLLHEPLIVVPGATTPIDIVMRDDNAEIEGTLRGVSSAAVSAAETLGAGVSTPPGYVYCIPLPDSAGQFLELPASPEGKFNYQMVAPGNYRVLAFKSQQRNLPYRDAQAMKPYETKGQVVRFAPGQKTSLELEVLSSVE